MCIKHKVINEIKLLFSEESMMGSVPEGIPQPSSTLSVAGIQQMMESKNEFFQQMSLGADISA